MIIACGIGWAAYTNAMECTPRRQKPRQRQNHWKQMCKVSGLCRSCQKCNDYNCGGGPFFFAPKVLWHFHQKFAECHRTNFELDLDGPTVHLGLWGVLSIWIMIPISHTFDMLCQDLYTINVLHIRMKHCKCLRCGKEWIQRTDSKPKTCPNQHCRSAYWDRPRKAKVNKKLEELWCPRARSVSRS